MRSKGIAGLSKILVEKYKGEVPNTFEALESLPPVGHKTTSICKKYMREGVEGLKRGEQTTIQSNSLSLNMDYRPFLEIRADKRFGKPCIKGTRITVYDVLNWLSNGMSREDIKSDFIELTDEMIDACLAYAADKERRLISVT